MGPRPAISRAFAIAWRVSPDATSWTIARHNITLDGEKNTFEPSSATNSRNSLKANRTLAERQDSVTFKARTAGDFRVNGHGMGISRASTLSNQLNVHPSCPLERVAQSSSRSQRGAAAPITDKSELIRTLQNRRQAK
jgi:hypothetical protein